MIKISNSGRGIARRFVYSFGLAAAAMLAISTVHRTRKRCR